MPLQIYNTLGRKKELFTPIHEGRVGMYFCGPTVYGDSHVGHAKAYITADIVNRYLRFLSYDVTYVQNITDVGHMTDNDDVAGEDKIEIQSRKEKKHPMEIAEYYTRRYFEDMDALNIIRPDISPRATGHIIEQIELIKELIEKGFAYESEGNVYFDVAKDKEYGKLSGRKAEDQEASGRVEERTDKRSPQDFALWKRAEKNHILRWPSPWGEGFPGWHIECSAMSMKYLGESFDIHGGGIENQFPHHECEIAQSECGTGVKPFVKYWMHNNMVTTGGVKMGKSLGNSAYLRDLYKQYDPLSLRFTILQSHYRGTTEFTEDAIKSADAGYQRLLKTYSRLMSEANSIPSSPHTEIYLDQFEEHPFRKEFKEGMDDDFNTARAIAVLYQLSSETNAYLLATGNQERLFMFPAYLKLWNDLAGNVLGILPDEEQTKTNAREILSRDDFFTNRARESSFTSLLVGECLDARDQGDLVRYNDLLQKLKVGGVSISDSQDGSTNVHQQPMNSIEYFIWLLINERTDARRRRDFAKSDELRQKLELRGVILEDTKEGTTWRIK